MEWKAISVVWQDSKQAQKELAAALNKLEELKCKKINVIPIGSHCIVYGLTPTK